MPYLQIYGTQSGKDGAIPWIRGSVEALTLVMRGSCTPADTCMRRPWSSPSSEVHFSIKYADYFSHVHHTKSFDRR